MGPLYYIVSISFLTLKPRTLNRLLTYGYFFAETKRIIDLAIENSNKPDQQEKDMLFVGVRIQFAVGLDCINLHLECELKPVTLLMESYFKVANKGERDNSLRGVC